MPSQFLRGGAAAAILSVLCLTPGVQAQVVPFQLAVQSGGTTLLVNNGASLTLAAGDVGQNASLTLTVTYQGQTSVALSSPQLFGPSSFTLGTSTGAAGATLQPGQSTSFTISYTATTSAQAVAQFTLVYTQAGATSQAPSTQGQLAFTLLGTSPELVVTYALPINGNVVTISDGNTITVPQTVVGSTTTTSMAVVNRGSGSGAIQSIAIMGSDPTFTLQSVPLLPLTTLAPNSAVQFSVVYFPTQTGNDSDMLQIVLADRTVTLGLQGTAIASLLSYQLVQGTQTGPLTPGQTITFPDTNIGNTNSVTVLVQNTSSTTIQNIGAAVTGSGYSITDEPILPLTLNVNQTASFTITFNPTQAGTVTGRFRIGNDAFNLSANAIGVQLVYSYTSGSATNPVLPTGVVVFSPLPAGQTESSTFTIQNNGTAAATITSIGISGPAPAAFTLSNLPQLPLSLAAGQNTQVSIAFTPQTTGIQTATLVVNDLAFSLSGFGNPPPALPSYQFSGASGTQAPLSQVSVGLALASPYTLPINGKLTISTNYGNLPADPSVQFATGGLIVSFTIPQGATQAVFPTGSQISLQTGTVTGTITLTPDFALASGLDITPASPQTVSFSVPAAPVHLLTGVIAAESIVSASQASVTLQVTGYTTTRILTNMQFQFTAASGASLTNGAVSVNIQPDAQAWFGSAQSQSFGGEFTIAVPFSLTTATSTTTTTTSSSSTPPPSLVSMLQSVSIMATNDSGNSNVVTIAFQ
jgi:Abnormal spindle-like microcephaly-assoc'd, ASPM-SPD-2-Hydin